MKEGRTMISNTPHLLVFAKHDGCKKEFIFAVPYYLEVRKGDILLVNTSKGVTIATATSEMFEGQDIDELAVKFGAYLPLKEVKQVAGKMLQTYIARKERSEIINKIQSRGNGTIYFELPF